jgi:hypothetical protein
LYGLTLQFRPWRVVQELAWELGGNKSYRRAVPPRPPRLVKR